MINLETDDMVRYNDYFDESRDNPRSEALLGGIGSYKCMDDGNDGRGTVIKRFIYGEDATKI